MSSYKSRSTRDGRCQDICARVTATPLLQPGDLLPSDSNSKVVGVLNPTVVLDERRRYLIFRVDEAACSESDSWTFNALLALPEQAPAGVAYRSHLRVGELTCGNSLGNLVALTGPDGRVMHHIEDPRLTLLEGASLLTYNRIDDKGSTSWTAHFALPGLMRGHRMILGPDHKHTCLFPERIRDTYYALTRPLARLPLHSTGVWLLESPDLVYWGVPRPLILPRQTYWDSRRTGPCGPPLHIERGWLQLYFGVDHDNSYHIGAALLDHMNPGTLLKRSRAPVLSPALEWERSGRRADAVFSGGCEAVDGRLRIYYGAADTCLGIAEVSIPDLLRTLE